MLRRAAIGSLLLALLFLLGHQLVPHLHQHQPEAPGISMQHAAQADWLSRIFGLDQGAEHLEHFRLSAEKSFHFTAPLPTSWELPRPRLEISQPSLPEGAAVPIPEFLRTGSQQRRGPPMV